MNPVLSDMSARLRSWLAYLDDWVRKLLRLERYGPFWPVFFAATERRLRGLMTPAGRQIFRAGRLERRDDLAGAIRIWESSTDIPADQKTAALQRLKFKLARKAARDRDWPQATQHYSELLAITPEDDRVRKGLAAASNNAARDAAAAGDFKGAIALWRENLEVADSEHARAFALQSLTTCAMRCALDAEQAQDFEAALANWQTFLTAKPGSLTAIEGIERCTRRLSSAA